MGCNIALFLQRVNSHLPPPDLLQFVDLLGDLSVCSDLSQEGAGGAWGLLRRPPGLMSGVAVFRGSCRCFEGRVGSVEVWSPEEVPKNGGINWGVQQSAGIIDQVKAFLGVLCMNRVWWNNSSSQDEPLAFTATTVSADLM